MSKEPGGAVEGTLERGRRRLAEWAGHATWSNVGLIAVIVAMVVVFSLLNPNFYSEVNVRNVGRQTAMLGIVACGQTMVILSGGFDLSVGMAMGLISVAGSMVMSEYGLWPGIFAGVAMGIAIGGLNGVMVAKAGLPPFIATLATFSAARGFALILSGGLPITDLPAAFSFLGAGQVFTIPLPAFIAATWRSSTACEESAAKAAPRAPSPRSRANTRPTSVFSNRFAMSRSIPVHEDTAMPREVTGTLVPRVQSF